MFIDEESFEARVPSSNYVVAQGRLRKKKYFANFSLGFFLLQILHKHKETAPFSPFSQCVLMYLLCDI